ncbi:GntP family permease [Pallidibacillus thermolactis]|uniref:GntP family permease n=1 Tax=Pallidibacillus thermolactis TaxID=251051 RepID=UPI0021D80EF9|nr:GntP family permease [Pallidibacillus thermolactis]MCU9600025.1 GntP family permease [Pallidibacillus thermolactis subsp. kokeshiiformis]
MDSSLLILVAVLGIFALLFLVMKSKLQAFIALILVSLLMGLLVGMSPEEIIETFDKGMGETVAFISIVIGLGAMFGEILRVSGGAERLALTLLDKFGEKRAPWALGLAGLIISIPIFLDVALVILMPILYALAKKSKKSLLLYGIPLLSGLLVAHAMIPPTPGPLGAASILNAELGWVILFSLLVGIPIMIIGGPLFGSFIANKIFIPVPISDEETKAVLSEEAKLKQQQKELPGFWSVLLIILLPLVLILLNTLAPLVLEEGSFVRDAFVFIGHPYVALTITTLLTAYIFGAKRGFTKDDIQEITTKALEPAGIIILITGAGGIFGEMLVASGIGDVLVDIMKEVNLPLIIFAYLTAVLLRLAIGSTTVAMITTSSIVAPLASALEYSGPALGILVITIASGAVIASHVNDSGFWMVNRYFGMSVQDTLKSWTAMSTIISVVGFILCLILSFIFI